MSNGVFMKYRKFNKYEFKEERNRSRDAAMAGEGMYLYENNSNASLTLPRPTASGLREIAPRKQFQGDNYYMQMVRTGMLRLIKTLQVPESQRPVETIVENSELKEEDKIMNEEKLMLDQPDIVTNEGKVEHVVENPTQNINEDNSEDQIDILINESPNGFVIVGE